MKQKRKQHQVPPPVTKKDVPPAGKAGECFWCKQKFGSLHKLTCVTWKRKVYVRHTLTLVHEVPMCWTVKNVNFHFNESSWCASNISDLIGDKNQPSPCLCPRQKSLYFGEVEGA